MKDIFSMDENTIALVAMLRETKIDVESMAGDINSALLLGDLPKACKLQHNLVAVMLKTIVKLEKKLHLKDAGIGRWK